MKRALDEFIIEGVKTTIPFHKLVLGKRQFLRGNATTSFIENNSIMEELKGIKERKKEQLPKQKKVLIVTTAVAQYLSKKQKSINNKGSNPWVIAARQESMNEGSLEE